MPPTEISEVLRGLMADSESVAAMLTFYEEIDAVYRDSLTAAGLVPAVAETDVVNTALCTVNVPPGGSANGYYVTR